MALLGRLSSELGGAAIVVVMAHEGGKCSKFDDPHDLSSCDPHQDLMPVVTELAPGTVDAIVAGHTHQGMAHIINNVPVIQSWANGRYFGRIDLKLDGKTGKLVGSQVFPPEEVVAGKNYEGAQVVADPAIAALASDDVEKARALQEHPLGVTLADSFDKDYEHESEEGVQLVAAFSRITDRKIRQGIARLAGRIAEHAGRIGEA